MRLWNELAGQILNWRGSLPKNWRLEFVSIHFSALFGLAISGLVLITALCVWPEERGLQTVAITLPVIWIGSLLLRITAQLLAIGSHGDHHEMVIGPVGNLSSDYEQLSGPAMMSYAVAGQAATVLVGFLGLLILSAVSPTPTTGLTIATVLDFRTGWDSAAWASQIVWVNGFLFVLHLLPAAPFDARALYVGWCRVSRPGIATSEIHRLLATTNSHLAIGMAAFSLAMIISRLTSMEPAIVWYCLLAVSVYLLIASQIEIYQAEREEVYVDHPLTRGWSERNVTQARERNSSYDPEFEFSESFDSLDTPSPHEVLDIDEILRKLHREGQDALSPFEKEALLSASRELQARRQTRQ